MIKNNIVTTTSYSGSSEQLIMEIRKACKDIADYRPDAIEMRPDYYNFIKANSMYMEGNNNYIPYYYGIKVEVKEDLDVPYKIIRGGEEISE